MGNYRLPPSGTEMINMAFFEGDYLFFRVTWVANYY